MHGGASPPVKLTPADAARPRFLSPNRVGAEIPQFAVLRDATPALEEDARGRALSGKVGLGRCSTAAFPFVKSRWNVNSPVYRLARCDSCSGRGCTGAHPHPAKFPRPAQYGRASFRQIALEWKFPADIIRLSPKPVRRKAAQRSGAATAGMRLKNLPLSEICPQNDASHGKRPILQGTEALLQTALPQKQFCCFFDSLGYCPFCRERNA